METSRKCGGERYVNSFDGFTHLLTMLYAVIMRFDSLREIETAMTAEVRKLHHLGIDTVPKYWDSIFKAEGITDRRKQQERIVKEKQQILDFLTGAENSGKV